MLVPGATSHVLEAASSSRDGQGRLRYLKAGSGRRTAVLLHTVRTQAEHFHRLVPLLPDDVTVYALDLPGMGHSEIVHGATYLEPDMRAGVKRLILDLDLRDVMLVGESMGAVLAMTTAADLPDRVERVVAVNLYDFAGGIARSGMLARLVVTGALAPLTGPIVARSENRQLLTRIMRDGLVNRDALTSDYVDELVRSGKRPGYPAVARAVFANLPSLIAARARYRDVVAPVHLVYGNSDWSRQTDRAANRDLLPDAQFTEASGAGHFISLERPELIVDLMAEGR